MMLRQIRELCDKVQTHCFIHLDTLSGLTVSAREQSYHCEICNGTMRVQKSYPHRGRTIAHGMFTVWETFWECANGCRHTSGCKVVQRAQSVSDILMPHSTIGYDVMAFIGRQRFLKYRQREEIQTQLAETYQVRLSSGEISRLAVLFTTYVARLHQAKTEQLKEILDHDGGWPMHVDATGENGRGTLLVVMAGWRKWVLGAWKIATEKQELIVPCLEEVVQRFGPPLTIMRDLGRAITPAVESLADNASPKIQILACHQHFLSDIGKDLLGEPNSELRNLFRRFNTQAQLRTLIRDLGSKIGDRIDKARLVVLNWQNIIETQHQIPSGHDGLAVIRNLTQWILDFAADASGLDFPYDRPYLDLYKRSQTVLRATDAFLRNLPDDTDVKRSLNRLHRILLPIGSEVPFHSVVKKMKKRARLFDDLRGQLRLSSMLAEDESIDDLDHMKNQLEEWTELLRKKRPARGPTEDIRQSIDIILKHIDVHGENLWGHAIALPDGNLRLVARTNALIENFFGEMKHLERRRSGRKNLTQDLEHLPAEAALVHNLNCNDYLSIVCGSIDELPAAFARLDADARQRQNQGIKPKKNEDLKRALQFSTASMSTADKRVIRHESMNKRIQKAANSRAPRIGY